jgi:hydroxymethylpyrimidine pyrophosphatase-like HAD family hydrolase
LRALVLVDLDDTLFQTLRKCPPDVPADALSALGFGRDGAPLGFATPRQARFLSWLGEAALIVPVTARGSDALGRVHIPFGAAICAHGGVILNEDGEPDSDWAAYVAREAAPHAAQLAALAESAAEIAGQLDVPIRSRTLTEQGIGLYVLIKHADGDAAALARVVDRLAPLVPSGWTVHRNGNNTALMPPFLGKAQAVRALLPRLRERHPDAPVIGIGDSLSDAPFMALCDYAMMPAGSQLSAAALETLVRP